MPRKAPATPRKAPARRKVVEPLYWHGNIPEGLGAAGLAAWQAVAPLAWVQESDYTLLQLLCETEDERAALRAKVMAPTGTWREETALRAIDTQLSKLHTMFGLSPQARKRLNVPTAERSVIDDLRAQAALRRARIMPS